MAGASCDIVVWQWISDEKQWCCYPPIVSNHIESQYGSVSQVRLAEVDDNLKDYTVDFNNKTQTNVSTGNARQVRRLAVSNNSCWANGTFWEWQNDNGSSWYPYSHETADYLEQQHKAKANSVDLHGLPYCIDFGAMVQVRNNTGRKRPIRRLTMSPSYCSSSVNTGNIVTQPQDTESKLKSCDVLPFPETQIVTSQDISSNNGDPKGATGESKNIVVWQWIGDDNQWCSYPPRVSNYIESQKGQNVTQVNLGQVDSNLNVYSVDLNNDQQINTSTGNQRRVQRITASDTSCWATGVMWEWENDDCSTWHPYTSDIADRLEQQQNSGITLLDLSSFHKSMPYTINFGSMRQIRKNTGTSRSIRRRKMSENFCNEAADVDKVPLYQRRRATQRSGIILPSRESQNEGTSGHTWHKRFAQQRPRRRSISPVRTNPTNVQGTKRSISSERPASARPEEAIDKYKELACEQYKRLRTGKLNFLTEEPIITLLMTSKCEKAYVAKQQEFANKYGQDSDESEEILAFFSDPSSINIAKVIQHGFSIDKLPTPQHSGIVFSQFPRVQKDNGFHTLLLCRILPGRVRPVPKFSSSDDAARQHFDSECCRIADSTERLIWNQNQILPMYVIYG